MNARTLLLLTATLLLPLQALGQPRSRPVAEPIRIAVAAPFSGSGAAFGAKVRQAAVLQTDEVNRRGGIGGRRVELVFADDRGSPSEAVRVARQLARDPSVSVVVGHFSSACTNASKLIYGPARLVSITPGATHPLVCRGFPYSFRILNADDREGIDLARYAKTVLGAKRVAVIFDQSDYARAIVDPFSKEAGKIGLEIAVRVPFSRERTLDFRPLAKTAKDAQPDVVVFIGIYAEAARIVKSVRDDFQMRTPFLACNGAFWHRFPKAAGPAAEGALVTTPFLPAAVGNDTRLRAFERAYAKRFGSKPDTWETFTYDAVGLAVAAVHSVGTDRERIRGWLAARRDRRTAWVGVTGATWFDANGDCVSKPAHVAVVKQGRFEAASKQLKRP